MTNRKIVSLRFYPLLANLPILGQEWHLLGFSQCILALERDNLRKSQIKLSNRESKNTRKLSKDKQIRQNPHKTKSQLSTKIHLPLRQEGSSQFAQEGEGEVWL